MNWISVDDRLPELLTGCIVAEKHQDGVRVLYASLLPTGFVSDLGWILRNVTHWMPLPDPPQ